MKRSVVLVVLAAGMVACGQASGADPPLPAELAAGRDVYGRSCATCHGATGQGGAGPSLADVVETFTDCDDHVAWVRRGSAGHLEAVGPTYGDVDHPVRGGMPGFEDSLADEQIRQVAAFQRHRFGGLEATHALAGCGLSAGATD
jgi:mono/diheme cytochrome c family protein